MVAGAVFGSVWCRNGCQVDSLQLPKDLRVVSQPPREACTWGRPGEVTRLAIIDLPGSAGEASYLHQPGQFNVEQKPFGK